MRHTNVLKFEQGFSIVEMLTVLVIVGILSAISAPSFLGWVQKQQIEEATTDLEGAIKEVQRQAIANSQTCSIDLNVKAQTGDPKIIGSIDNAIKNCLLTGDRILENVELELEPETVISLSFNHKGERNISGQVTITLNHATNSNLKRCLVVSYPLGLIDISKNCESSLETSIQRAKAKIAT